MTKEELKNRTKKFALRIIKLVEALPKTKTGDVVGKQLLRCGTSVAANYRAACRAKSTSDFISKLGIVEEEGDESMFWLEIIIESNLMAKELVESLLNEADEIVAIIVSSKKTTKDNKSKFENKNLKK
jgi:four helix bundle protein